MPSKPKSEIAVRDQTYQRLRDYARRHGTQLRVIVLDAEERKN